ncbi:MAG: hypothetical protein WC639_04745 [Patescibacteria group bacterium]|jgi:hypothetical protein
MTFNHACPKCHGDLFPAEDEFRKPIYSCLQCGKQVAIGEIQKILLSRKKEERRRKMETVTNQIPPKPEGTHNLAKYYEANKQTIISDLNTLGLHQTVLKWGFSGSGFWLMRKRWGVVPTIKPVVSTGKGKLELPVTDKPVKQEKPITPQDVIPPVKPVVIDGIQFVVLKAEMPKFPEWNDNWYSDMKMKWLECYAQIMSSQRVTA